MHQITRRAVAALAALGLGAGLAACGGSSAAGVELAPQGGRTEAPATSATTTPTSTTPTTTTPAVTTPTSGPLSKEPAVPKQTGPAPTHLVTKDLIVGTGAEATSGSSVTVNYVGALYKNNKIFDASWKRNQTFGPFVIGQGAVIKGWDQGLEGMKVGGRRLLVIPAKLGYGSAGSPPTIPPNAALVFVVDLLAVH
jgi:FKBP-type peptidyl-prolyl cis-trans isomerase